MQTFETGYRSTLSAKLNATDVTISVATAPTVTAGRMHIYKGNTHAWIKYTGVSGTTLTGVTFVSQTTDPTTTVTGVTFPAGTSIELVEMHDQMLDKQQPTASNQIATTYATTTDRDTALGGDGVATVPYVDIYVTATGFYYNYNLSSNQWETVDIGTPIGNASTTVAGKVELPTTAEVQANTSVGGTGATLALSPAQLGLYYSKGDGSDGSVVFDGATTILGMVPSGNVYTMTRDIYTINLTVNTGISVNPAGYVIYSNGTMTLSGTAKIIRNGNNGSGATGGTALATGTVGASLGGSNGGAQSTSAGNAGTASTAVSPSYATTSTGSAVGGTGGNGGTSGAAGGTTAVATQGILYNTALDLGKILATFISPSRGFLNTSVYGALPNGTGGGSGGGGAGATGGAGGGGGGNGGTIFIYANIVAGSGTVEAVGGTGGNGAVGFGGFAGGGGGGAGGSGGIVVIVYNFGTPWTRTLTGGTGGSGGAGASGGTSGASGATGTVGQSILINV